LRCSLVSLINARDKLNKHYNSGKKVTDFSHGISFNQIVHRLKIKRGKAVGYFIDKKYLFEEQTIDKIAF
jgi:hypothetical protein